MGRFLHTTWVLVVNLVFTSSSSSYTLGKLGPSSKGTRSSISYTARSAGSHISQFFDLLPFLGHQKIFYKTCMCAVKVALNFLPIRKKCYKHFSYLTVFQDSGLGGVCLLFHLY